MNNLLHQISVFASEIAILLDQGKCISIKDFETIMDNGNIVDYIGENYGFQNIESTPQNQNELKSALNEVYVSKSEAQKRMLVNNGLIYLYDILFEILLQKAYDLKFNSQ